MATAESGGFQLQHVRGDLFSCRDNVSLAHCVSEDLRMGKGIATLFKNTFAGVPELKLQAKKVGDVAILRRGKRIVFYLITKLKYYQRPTYDTLRGSLEAMKKICVNENLTELAMPKIGCGLDKLEWLKVEAMIMEIFQDTDLTVMIYTL